MGYAYGTVKINDLIVSINYIRNADKSSQDDALHKPPALLFGIGLILTIRRVCPYFQAG